MFNRFGFTYNIIKFRKGEENEKGITIGIINYHINNANNDYHGGNSCKSYR